NASATMRAPPRPRSSCRRSATCRPGRASQSPCRRGTAFPVASGATNAEDCSRPVPLSINKEHLVGSKQGLGILPPAFRARFLSKITQTKLRLHFRGRTAVEQIIRALDATWIGLRPLVGNLAGQAPGQGAGLSHHEGAVQHEKFLYRRGCLQTPVRGDV